MLTDTLAIVRTHLANALDPACPFWESLALLTELKDVFWEYSDVARFHMAAVFIAEGGGEWVVDTLQTEVNALSQLAVRYLWDLSTWRPCAVKLVDLGAAG